jgi:hypothetical protein
VVGCFTVGVQEKGPSEGVFKMFEVVPRESRGRRGGYTSSWSMVGGQTEGEKGVVTGHRRVREFKPGVRTSQRRSQKGMVNAGGALPRPEMHQMSSCRKAVHDPFASRRARGSVVEEGSVASVDVSQYNVRHWHAIEKCLNSRVE